MPEFLRECQRLFYVEPTRFEAANFFAYTDAVNSPLQTSSPQAQNVLSGDALTTPQNQIIDNSSALSSTRSADSSDSNAPALSVVIPVYNEEESLHSLHEKLQTSLAQLNLPFEVLYIDDGSRDSSFQILSDFAAQDSRVKVIRFRRNFGQTAAMSAGMESAQGRVIIPLDADGQNDPADIRNLLDKMNEGFDVVSGWRKNRKDDSIRRIPSRIANRIISKVTGVPLHDYGCSLKAYRADVIKDVSLYGEMHRFIPAYAAMVGARVTEIPVQHHARVAGVSKYGIGRTFKVLLDLLVVKFLGGYGSKPIYFFGGAGVWSFLTAFVLWMIVAIQKFSGMHYSKVHNNPLFYVGMLAFAMGFQFLMLGLLAEVAIRTYHESQGKTTYTVAETRNIDKKVKA